MSYESVLTKICHDYRAEIEADLVAAKAEVEEAQDAVDRVTRRVQLLEGLLQPYLGQIPAERSPFSDSVGKLTLHAAMQKVLRESETGKLRAGEIIAEIARLNLYRMKDGRLPESQQIHARASHYPQLFGKDGSFFYAKE